MKLLLYVLLVIPVTMYSQDFNEYKWKKRLIVIQSSTFEDSKAVEQIEYLKAVSSKFIDYKLLIVENTNNGQRVDFGKIKKVSSTDNIENFKVVLIGLDGGVKFESTEVVSAQKFFDLISSMPMYRKEKR